MTGRPFRPSSWLEIAAIPLILAVMRVAWTVPLVQVALNNPFVFPRGLIVPPAWLLVLLLIPGYLYRLPIKPGLAMGLAVTLGLLTIPITWALTMGPEGLPVWPWFAEQVRALTHWERGIPSGLVLMLTAVLTWQRGLWGASVHYNELWRGFVWGSVALGTVMLFREQTLADVAGVNMAMAVATFLLAGLLGLALLALTGTLATENLRSSGTLGVSRYWLGAVASAIGAVLLLGWAVGLVLAPETVARGLRYLRPVADVLLQAFIAVATLLAYLVLWLIVPLMQTAYERIRPILLRDDLGSLRRFLLEDVKIGEREPPALGPAWDLAWRPLFLMSLVGLGVWIVLRAWRKRRVTTDAGMVERRESIMTVALLRGQLRDLLDRQRATGPGWLPLDPEASPRDAIRAAYQRLLDLSRRHGIPRPAGSSPAAYERLLAARWPEGRGPVTTLTALYVRARYGDAEPDADDVVRAQQALSEIEQDRA